MKKRKPMPVPTTHVAELETTDLQRVRGGTEPTKTTVSQEKTGRLEFLS
jgi:hypothetical protein